MQIEEISREGYEQILHATEPESNLNALICIHRSMNGLATGGCRMWAYPDEAAMLQDALNLSRAMTYKASFSDLKVGGGKSVIWGDPATAKTPQLYRAMGRFVHSFQGRFYTGKDVGTELTDIDYMKEETPYVMDRHFISGNSSLFTAYGVYQALLAALVQLNLPLSECKLGIQGAGAVAQYLLAGFGTDALFQPLSDKFPGLAQLCPKIVICDVNPQALHKLSQQITQLNPALLENIQIVSPEALFEQDIDIFMPCAMGGILNPATIAQLQQHGVQAVVGCANTQLASAEADQLLREKNILYLPDYAVNAGGLIVIYYELAQHLKQQPFLMAEAVAELEKIKPRLLSVLQEAKQQHKPTGQLADEIAEQKLRHFSL